jgi:hypothetical protein
VGQRDSASGRSRTCSSTVRHLSGRVRSASKSQICTSEYG